MAIGLQSEDVAKMCCTCDGEQQQQQQQQQVMNSY
jgi:hypothetical protein